jgi:hypothetical protein
MVGEGYISLPPQATALFSFLHQIGGVLAIAVTAVAAGFALVAWRGGHVAFGAAVFLGVTFLFPMYLTSDYALGFTSFVIAHGLQYLIFLAVHSGAGCKPHERWPMIVGPAVLVATILLGSAIWDIAPLLNSANLPSLGVGLTISVTLAHVWVDRFIWRMRDTERARWVRTRFCAVLQPITPRIQIQR